jgi:hypothetical protein
MIKEPSVSKGRRATCINVGYYNPDFEDPPGLPRSLWGPGWREVQIDGDTRLDIELVRRAAAAP